MKKKIEISIFHVLIYVIAFLLVSGMLFYKSCLDPNQTEIEITAPIEEEQQTVRPDAKKVHPTKPTSQPADKPETFPAEEGEFETEPEVVTSEEKHKTAEQPKDRRILIFEQKSLFNLSYSPDNPTPEGKKYYENENGRLESIIVKASNDTSELLIARNSQGEETGRLEISRINADGKITKYATFSQNKIRVFEIISSEKKKKEEEIHTEYTIRQDFQFVRGKSYSKLK